MDVSQSAAAVEDVGGAGPGCMPPIDRSDFLQPETFSFGPKLVGENEKNLKKKQIMSRIFRLKVLFSAKSRNSEK